MNIIRKLIFINLCMAFLAGVSYAANPVICTGATIPLTASNASDSDCDYTGDCPESVPDNDGFTYTWSVTWTVGGGPAGTFPGSNVGQSVQWTAPTSPGDVNIGVTATNTGGDKYVESRTAEKTVTVVKVDKLQYNDPTSGWTDVTGTLYVHKGGSIEFKAIKSPADASWPSGKPAWGGTSGASGTGETKNVTFNTVSSSSTDYKTVTAECGNTVTANVVVYEMTSQTVSTSPANRDRTTLGLGEEVTCSTNPSVSVQWSVTGDGSVYPEQGTSITYTAIKLLSTATVHAKTGLGDSTKDFIIIHPDGMNYSADNADAGGFPHTAGPPNNYIGNGRKFTITIQPTTVSFYNVEFRENKPGNNWQWPDGTDDSASAGQPPFTVAYDNDQAADSIVSGARPYSRLFDGNDYVPFSYRIHVPLEYKNEAEVWQEFMDEIENYHDKIFTAAGGCSLKAVGSNTKQSTYRGPWQD